MKHPSNDSPLLGLIDINGFAAKEVSCGNVGEVQLGGFGYLWRAANPSSSIFPTKKIFAESPWGDGGAGVMRQVNEAVKTLIGK